MKLPINIDFKATGFMTIGKADSSIKEVNDNKDLKEEKKEQKK
jgi:hypothetical protein